MNIAHSRPARPARPARTRVAPRPKAVVAVPESNGRGFVILLYVLFFLGLLAVSGIAYMAFTPTVTMP